MNKNMTRGILLFLVGLWGGGYYLHNITNPSNFFPGVPIFVTALLLCVGGLLLFSEGLSKELKGGE